MDMPHTRLSILALLLIISVLSAPALRAQDAGGPPEQLFSIGVPGQPALIQGHERIFDLGEDVRKFGDGRYNFIPIIDVGWIKERMQRIPALEGLVYDIDVRSQSLDLTWPRLGPSEPSSRVSWSRYDDTERVPAGYRKAGFESRIQGRYERITNVILLPKDQPQNFFVFCSGGFDFAEGASGCSIFVKYPPDDFLRLQGRLFRVTPPIAKYDFHAIAAAMLEVAYCLDVTEEFAAEGARYRSPGPRPLTGCRQPTS